MLTSGIAWRSRVVAGGAAAIAIVAACAGTAPRTAEPEHVVGGSPDAAVAAEGVSGADASARPDGDAGDAAADGGPAPQSAAAPRPREDPVPWAWIEEHFASAWGGGVESCCPSDLRVEPISADLDGDGREELVVNLNYDEGQELLGRAVVARRTARGFLVICDSDFGNYRVVNLPGGLGGLIEYEPEIGYDEFFDIHVLPPGRNQLVKIFEGSYDHETTLASVTCASDAGPYNPSPEAEFVYSERDGVRVLEAISENVGCPESPRTNVIRTTDLLRRAHVLPAERLASPPP